MNSIKAFIKKHPLLSYFALAFAISWGGVLFVAGGPGGISANSEASEMQVTFLYPAVIVGPSVAAILLTGLLYGGAGFREFGWRLFKWRVGGRWYAVALLTAPLLVTGTLLAFSLISPEFLPRLFTSDDKASLPLFGIAAGLIGEVSWRSWAGRGSLCQHCLGGVTVSSLQGSSWGCCGDCGTSL